jgi:hypothetical protein
MRLWRPATMRAVSEEANPDNPRCPICGATDWFGLPELDYSLLVVHKGTTRAFEPTGKPLALPVEGFTCRVCRFLRLRATKGTLEWPDTDDTLESR